MPVRKKSCSKKKYDANESLKILLPEMVIWERQSEKHKSVMFLGYMILSLSISV